MCLALLGTGADSRPPPTRASSIVGYWGATDSTGVDGAFDFAADGSADIINSGVSLRAEAAKNGGGTITYRFDPSVTPATLDIVITAKSGETRTILAIVEFLSADSFRIRISNASRPADFAGTADDTIVLHRRQRPPESAKPGV